MDARDRFLMRRIVKAIDAQKGSRQTEEIHMIYKGLPMKQSKMQCYLLDRVYFRRRCSSRAARAITFAKKCLDSKEAVTFLC